MQNVKEIAIGFTKKFLVNFFLFVDSICWIVTIKIYYCKKQAADFQLKKYQTIRLNWKIICSKLYQVLSVLENIKKFFIKIIRLLQNITIIKIFFQNCKHFVL